MISTDNDFGGRQDSYRGVADAEGGFMAGRADDFTIFVRVAYSCDCDYCLDKHVGDEMPDNDAAGIPLPIVPESPESPEPVITPDRVVTDGSLPAHGLDMRA